MFHKILGNSRIAEQLVASEEEISFIKLFSLYNIQNCVCSFLCNISFVYKFKELKWLERLVGFMFTSFLLLAYFILIYAVFFFWLNVAWFQK
jgi:hypothetical protein